MSYAIKTKSKYGNTPIELISFRTGPNSHIRTTTHERELVIAGEIYSPFPFDRKNRKISTAFDDDGAKVTVAADHPICEHYRTVPTSYDVSVIIHRGYVEADGTPHSNDLEEYPVLVFGWVGAAEMDAENGEMTIAVVTLGDTMAAPTLTRHYQHSCPLRLYGPKCGAVRVPIAVTPESLLKGKMGLPLGWEGANEISDFVGGIAEFSKGSAATEHRMIFQALADGVKFVGSMANLEDYTSVTISLGCKRTLEACRNLHNNSIRYGGFPYMPLKNPVNKSQR